MLCYLAKRAKIMKTYKVENIESWEFAPTNTMQSYCPTFRNKTNDQIIKELNPERNWLPFGYNHFIICQSIGTVFISRISLT
jgi:hypothetical protein